jgi:hypothetical protein
MCFLDKVIGESILFRQIALRPEDQGYINKAGLHRLNKSAQAISVV